MTLTAPPRRITAGDDELRAHLAEADVPALLIAIAHLTGDFSLLRTDYADTGWLFRPQGGLPTARQEQVRERALAALARYRDQGCPPVPPPDESALARVAEWALGPGGAEFAPLLAEEVVGAGDDPKVPGWHVEDVAPDRELRVGVIGAGMSGLLAAHRLTQAGVPVTVFEKNPEVGGTWWENTYPGCRVDVPSHLYGYSFAAKSDWPDYFCAQDELLAYFRDFAKEFGLRDRVRFDTEVRAAAWDEDSATWRLTLDTPDGPDTAEVEVLVSAVGQLNRPSLPDIPGRDDFTGPAFHSARWDHSVDLAGKRVGVIGTGASAFQIVPAIADEVAELTVFQRTPAWLRPTPHYRSPVPVGLRWLFEHVPYYLAWYRFWLFAPGLRGVLEAWVVDPDYPPTERAVSRLNEEMRGALADAMDAQLADAPWLRPHVVPDYPVGAKRVLRDDGAWLATLKRPDVHLVTDAIERITPTGVRTDGGGDHPLDVVVYATGFAASGFLAPMRVTGRDGVDLHEAWDGDARAYLGMTVPGFPNLFCLYGPNTNLSGQGGSIFYFSECAVGYLLDAVRLLLTGGHRALSVRRAAHDDHNAWVDAANRERAWGFSSVRTWAVDRARGRSAQNWPFSALEYWRRTRAVHPADYELG
ncbi:NAD(P)/FAD-dependent oxidoreductase [Actinokineospora sp. NBRC 105648]|uniref:flavin-containing monooxygenase n=1 Tax=Actinokineospora sp. NBRC 105648 TaxID=3032206 RepID=UPI0024A333BD|nr:NAD(P)/FAD-dependent oxidoreductase [Actinokineospora sp. NBRC 105648]GLZ38899.1 monooxygenase [Actinokineospora sp. NBRC 105648]